MLGMGGLHFFYDFTVFGDHGLDAFQVGFVIANIFSRSIAGFFAPFKFGGNPFFSGLADPQVVPGLCQFSVSWLRGRFTTRFAEQVYRLTSITTNAEAGWYLNLDDETVYRIDRSMLEELAKEKLSPVPTLSAMSVDEVAWQKWHRYVTNVVDIDKTVNLKRHGECLGVHKQGQPGNGCHQPFPCCP